MDKQIKEYFSSLGKKSVSKRFANKSDKEISAIMQKVSNARKKNRV